MARRASAAFGTNVGGHRRRVSASDLEECRSRNGRGILYHHQHGPWDTTRNRRKRQAVRYAGRIPDRSGHLVLVPHCEILWPDQTASQASEGYQASGQADQVATQAPCRDLERPHCGRSQETLNSSRLQCGWAYSNEYSLLASELMPSGAAEQGVSDRTIGNREGADIRICNYLSWATAPTHIEEFLAVSRDGFLSESSRYRLFVKNGDNREPPERFLRVGELSGMAKASGALFCRAAPRGRKAASTAMTPCCAVYESTHCRRLLPSLAKSLLGKGTRPIFAYL